MKAVLVALALAAASFPACAETVAGWQVTPAPEADGVCLARRDEGGKYVALAFDKDDQNTLRLIYELGNAAWTLEPQTALPAALIVGTDVSNDNVRWVAISATSLFTWSVLPDKMVEDLKGAQRIGIRFTDGTQQETTISLAGFTQALPTLVACRSKMR